MPPSRDYTDYRKVYFRPEMKNCPACGSVLKRSHVAWSKGVQAMKGNIYATSHAYRCSNMDCGGGMFKSAEAEALSLPFRTYALDIVVEIGNLRHSEKRPHSSLGYMTPGEYRRSFKQAIRKEAVR